ncbi:MAG: glycosyltransferase [Bacteroidota bacterium]
MKPVVVQYNSSYLPITEVWIYNQLMNLVRFQTHFLCRRVQNRELFPLENLFALNDLPLVSRIFNLFFFKLIGYIPRFATFSSEACLLHVHFGNHAIKMTGLKQYLNIPMVCSFYGIDAYSFPQKARRNKRQLERMFLHTDKILVLGPYMRNTLVSLGCPESKIIIHHLGVNTAEIRYEKRVHDPSRPIKFLLASSFREKKGMDISLKALANLKEEIDFTVDIVGDGPQKDELLEIMDQGGIRDRITLHGFQSYKYFIDLTYHCDIFLQASKTTHSNDKEGTPMSLVDAMATGLPVVATRHSDIPEIVQHGSTGFLAEENSINDFEEAILTMVQHISEISAFSERSRQWIEKHFDVKKQSEKLSGIYNELMKCP